MPIFKNKAIQNTGFDNATNQDTGRILNKNGKPNVIKIGMSFLKRLSLYHVLIKISLFQFLALCIFVYSIVNILFALLFFLLNPQNLGIDISQPKIIQFLNCAFFSAQTLTTVGYGRINPQSIPTSFLASIESFIGLLLFAVLTGLIYGRFSKPEAFLIYSKNALISPYNDGKALMIRMSSYIENQLTDINAKMLIKIKQEKNGIISNQFYPLKLESSDITTLHLSWTLVHKIDEESPMFEITAKDFEKKQLEILVFITGFDEHFSATVKSKTSYDYTEIIQNAKFKIMFAPSEDNRSTILDLSKIDEYERLN